MRAKERGPGGWLGPREPTPAHPGLSSLPELTQAYLSAPELICLSCADGADLVTIMAIASSYNSIYLCGQSCTAARTSCGGLSSLTEAVLAQRVRNGFAIIRPPGHHAEHDAVRGPPPCRAPIRTFYLTFSRTRARARGRPCMQRAQLPKRGRRISHDGGGVGVGPGAVPAGAFASSTTSRLQRAWRKRSTT